MDGASKFQRTIHIILPLTKPTTLYLSVTSVISMLKLFVIIQLLTDGGPNNSSMTMMYYLYRNAFSYDKKNILRQSDIDVHSCSCNGNSTLGL